MSRKREKQRDAKRELAKQLGDADVDAEQLRAHSRSSEPELRAELHVDKRRLHVLPPKTTLDVALYVVDAMGPRYVNRARYSVPRGSGNIALSRTEQHGVEKIRYTRPGSFVVVAAVDLGNATLLEDPARLDIAVLAKRQSAVALRVLDVDGAVLAIPAPDRVQAAVTLPLDGAELTGTLTLHVRL